LYSSKDWLQKKKKKRKEDWLPQKRQVLIGKKSKVFFLGARNVLYLELGVVAQVYSHVPKQQCLGQQWTS
jgi:hypothetical protein